MRESLYLKFTVISILLFTFVNAGNTKSDLFPLGGCKDHLSIEGSNDNMLCKTDCSAIGHIGRDSAITFRLTVQSPGLILGVITVQNRVIGFPQPEDPYIGILRLDKTFCSEALLIELEANNKVQFNIGDRTNSNHWLESIGYFRDLGEHWRRPALFVQFRRGPMTDEELITKNGKRDQIYIMIKVNDEDVGGAIGLDHIETCLQKAHLSVIPDDNKSAFTADYTRCAAFNRYQLDVNWNETDFLSSWDPDQTFSKLPRIMEDFGLGLAENWNVERVPYPYNYELQFYTKREENVRVEDDKLKIVPLKETFQHKEYTSGKVTSKFSMKYGRLEVVAKTPNGFGLWPAIWMMPVDEHVYGGHPLGGEIDIFEGQGQNTMDIISTVHYGNPLKSDSSGFKRLESDTSSGMHLYTFEWNEFNLIFKFDDEIVHVVDIDKILQEGTYAEKQQPFDQEFYLILNCAVGGSFVDDPSDSTVWNYPDAELWVDSVKLFDYVGGGRPLHSVCQAKPDAAEVDLCNASKYVCNAQDDVADVEQVCDSKWKQCCYKDKCTKEELVESVSAVFDFYHSNIQHSNSCNFSGTAFITYRY